MAKNKKVWIELEFEAGQIVYLKTDPDQFERIVTGEYFIDRGGEISYFIRCGTEESSHCSFELSTTRKIMDEPEEE